MQTFAIIPAAGKSTRMGRAKLGLPLGDRTVLERVVDALRQVSLAEILVVLGPHVANLQGMAEKAGARALVLPEETGDMRATVEHGLRWIEERHRPQPEDAFLLCLADHPTVDGDVVQMLLRQASAKPQAAGIWIPTFEGRRGHPTLVAWSHVAGIRALPPGQGLNRYFRAHAAEAVEMPCDSPDILLDLDTPEDYDRLCARFRRD